MADDCRFCDIVAGRLEADIVLGESGVTAFLDIRPLFPGHVLVVPSDHHETLVDLPPGVVGPLFLAVRRLAIAIGMALEAPGTFVAVNNKVSQSVPHLHVHVVPRRFQDGLRGFFWPRQRYAAPLERAQMAERIRAAVPPA